MRGWLFSVLLACSNAPSTGDAGADASAKDAKSDAPVNPWPDAGAFAVPSGTLVGVGYKVGDGTSSVFQITLPSGQITSLWPLPISDAGTLVPSAIARRPDGAFDYFAHTGGATPTTHAFVLDATTGATLSEHAFPGIVGDVDYASDGTLWALFQDASEPPRLVTLDAAGTPTTMGTDSSQGNLAQVEILGTQIYVEEVDGADGPVTVTLFSFGGGTFGNPQIVGGGVIAALGGAFVVFENADIYAFDPATLANTYTTAIHTNYAFVAVTR